PGLGAKVAPPTPVEGYRTIAPQRMRHSSVRGDFRVYRTAAGIVTSWKTELSARTVDGKPMWKKEDQGRAVAISPDGSKIVTNNDAGELLILDAKTGTPSGAATQLGGRGDSAREGVWISAFAWMPDGKRILALDSKHLYVVGADGAVQKELPVKCKEDCFFTSAAGVSNDEAIVCNGSGTSAGQLLKIKVADGSTVAAVDYYGHDLDLSADRSAVLVDGSNELSLFDTATLKPRWTTPLPGYRGIKMKADSEGWTEWKSVPKLSPDGKYIAVNDTAGRLWVIDAAGGSPLFAYPTELVDFVEDAMWLDGATLIAIDNPGHVLRIQGTPAKAAWSEMDGPAAASWDEP
ncbi:MAG: hypothetical protein ABI175_17930, partial [Polyangiales bacterium]